MKKRRVLKIILISLLAFVLLFIVWAFFIEPNRLTVKHVTLELPNWSPQLDGLRVVAVADVHAGSPFINEAKLDKLVEKINAEQPDCVFLLGDFLIQGVVGGKYMPPEVIAKHLANLHARYGVYAVFGNHDWWGDGRGLMRELNKAGIRVLENETARVEINHQTLLIVGVPDLWTRKPKIKEIFKRIDAMNDDEKRAPLIVLTHNPDIFPEIPARASLTLAGHTHGGQVILPFIGAPVNVSRYGKRFLVGHIVEGGRHLYVTPGIGTSSLPARFGAPPEISVLTLKSSEQVALNGKR